ncbi:HD domain-containing protein, partial [Candidatus Aerophobetes bacterium]|nr:HD domain-containing protein [Candidatus Aerophobetes bacterium]
RTTKISGHSKKELVQQPFLEFIHPEDREIVKKEHSEMLKGERPSHHLSFRIIDRKGNIRWMEAHEARITWKKKPAILTLLSDITKRKKAEKELKESLETLRKLLEEIIRAMALIVEKKDPYTAGHQQRVSSLARAIATQMKLPEDQIEKIHIAAILTAAILHDIGKIIIPTEILSKPSKLTDVEFSFIKKHPEIAYEIIKEIEFPYPIAQIALQHHERMDGSGYPQGLKGENILLEARILAVADVVEAMSSHRPYRPALGINRALEEIEKNKGKLYDPEVGDACIRLFKEKGFKF